MDQILKIKSIRWIKKFLMLVKKTDLNAKIAEVEGKVPNITGLATNLALTTVENKIPDVSGLVQKQFLILKLLK